jgi:hypothetical protein
MGSDGQYAERMVEVSKSVVYTSARFVMMEQIGGGGRGDNEFLAIAYLLIL